MNERINNLEDNISKIVSVIGKIEFIVDKQIELNIKEEQCKEDEDEDDNDFSFYT